MDHFNKQMCPTYNDHKMKVFRKLSSDSRLIYSSLDARAHSLLNSMQCFTRHGLCQAKVYMPDEACDRRNIALN